MQSKHFGPRFEAILMIQTIYIVDFVVNINTVKNHIDWAQFSNRSVLFYTLINECATHDSTHLSLYKLLLIDH